MDNKTVCKTLNDLIETSEDGKKGFAEAAEKATDASLKAELGKRALQCATAAQELQAVVRSMGGEPESGGSLTGAAHRGWVAVKTAIVGDNNVAVLEEVERGEDYAKAAYKKALATDLPMTAKTLVEKQYQGALRNHDRIRELRDTYRRAA
ncbi:MAG: PA2169 family four-helix-bundle protein [Panacagrimonas sp.]